MIVQKHARLISVATNLALILSLLLTSNAHADDSTTPTTDEAITPSGEQPPTDTPTVPELLEELPQNTDLVVIVENTVVPLVTNEAAIAISQGDPIWCPAGVVPTPSANGCTDSYADLESLIDDFDNAVITEPNANGTIWIMSGAEVSIFDIVIDGSIHTNWSNYTLTLQGGWDGSSLGIINGVSSFSIPISVVNWNNTVTISNFNISNTYAIGLEVDTSGDIIIENVTSDNNINAGADLYSSNGSITLSGINSFSKNGDTGAYLDANGNIVIENMTASNNSGNGTEIYSPGNIIINGNNVFINNNGTGLYVEAGNTIEAENITATNNKGNGTELYAGGDIILNGTNLFSQNNDSGLYAEAEGNFHSNSVNAIENGGSGAELYITGNITINGTNFFIANNDSGLYVETNGDIQGENITANGNGGYGVEIYADGSTVLGGLNVFSGNNDSGLYLEANDNIDIDNITADGNLGSGVEIQTLGTVNVGGTNVFTNNYFDGLFIDTENGIFIYNINSHNNGLSGIYLESNGNATITCGFLSNNAGYEIEADMNGSLILNGVNFGGDIDGEISFDEDYLILNSNSCFTYPVAPSDSDDENYGNETDTYTTYTAYNGRSSLPINIVMEKGGERINLDCENYKGTLIFNQEGDGAYIPCPLIGKAMLFDVARDNLHHPLQQNNSFVSGFTLTILDEDNKVLVPKNIPGSIWYSDPGSASGMQAFYWHGNTWVEFTDQITPFMNIFFKIPDELKNADLAILYWDGMQWVELSDNQFLGNGYIVKSGGHVSNDGLYFEATMNFTGTFVLVQK